MKKQILILLTWFALLGFGYAVLEITAGSEKSDNYDTMLRAAEIMQEAQQTIYNHKVENDIIIPEEDVNQTGLIGEEFNGITTSLGALDAKRTSTNPNMAAVIVDMLYELGVNDGDTIALNFSSSFPAGNIAALCAMESMNLKGTAITSLGASTYGGNIPEFTYIDMEKLIYDAGIVSTKSTYFSMGGAGDTGNNMMQPELIQPVVERHIGYGTEYLYFEDLNENISYRYDIYNESEDIKAFITVGGNGAAFGRNSMNSYHEGGIITELNVEEGEHGLVQLFYLDTVPTIYMLNIKGIATDYGLPIDPVPLPVPGEGGVYYEKDYNEFVAIVLLILSVFYIRKMHRNRKSGVNS